MLISWKHWGCWSLGSGMASILLFHPSAQGPEIFWSCFLGVKQSVKGWNQSASGKLRKQLGGPLFLPPTQREKQLSVTLNCKQKYSNLIMLALLIGVNCVNSNASVIQANDKNYLNWPRLFYHTTLQLKPLSTLCPPEHKSVSQF